MSADLIGCIQSDYKVEMTIRGHQVIADEPEDLGGTDKGPKPGELVLSALAGCKLITMQMYAQRKGWKFEDATIELRYLEKGDPTIVEKKIRFTGDLSKEQQQRLIEISGRCPVAKMLSKSIAYQLV